MLKRIVLIKTIPVFESFYSLINNTFVAIKFIMLNFCKVTALQTKKVGIIMNA